jgi:hypothetical protein
MAAGDSGKVEGAALGAAPSALSNTAIEIGSRIARKIFEQRGNNHEVHLRESELAGYCIAAAEAAIIRVEGKVHGS